jgi:hypothetical protein
VRQVSMADITLELGKAHVAGMRRAPRWSMNSKEYRRPRARVAVGSAARVLAFHLQPEMLERARHRTDRLRRGSVVRRSVPGNQQWKRP